jgi:heat-inducible transcriptional repressor
MKQINIEERRKKILCAIVESYVETAVPVGSRTVSQRFRSAISPATVRNVMADLEEIGYISHPHTSAGRVPTDKGYRTYVDSLLEPGRLTKEEEVKINELVSRKAEDIDFLMRAASKSISMITNVAGIVLTPRLKRSVFKHIEFIPIDSSRVLTVLITGSGFVKNTIFESGETITRDEFLRIARFLNEVLAGMLLGEIKNYLTRRLIEQRDSFYTFLEKALILLSSPSLLKAEDQFYFDGAAAIMSYPEFSEISKARSFLMALEEKEDIIELFNHDMETDGIKVHIGRENSCKYMQECAIITANYKINDNIIGVLGAIGPTRMEYSRVISAVKYLSEVLGKALEDIG